MAQNTEYMEQSMVSLFLARITPFVNYGAIILMWNSGNLLQHQQKHNKQFGWGLDIIIS